MKSLVLTGCCLVALALFVPAILGGCETKQARYETVTEARSAGLFSRGWAPDVLPKGAGPVIEAHDLDTNARCFRAALQPDSAGAVRFALSLAGFASGGEAATWQEPEGFCPFSRSDVEEGRFLHRRKGKRGIEYAALGNEGMLYYWSAGDVSR